MAFFKKFCDFSLQMQRNLLYYIYYKNKEGEIMGKFVIKKTPTGAFNFSLYAANMEKIAVSSQVYSTKAA